MQHWRMWKTGLARVAGQALRPDSGCRSNCRGGDMNDEPANRPPRILIVDDNAAIHNDFRKTLGSPPAGGTQLDDLEKSLFGGTATPAARAVFRIDSAFQGKEALAMVQRALQESDPYVLAFVDIRMPPGWDGVETLEHFGSRSAGIAGRHLHRLFGLFLG